MDKQKAIVLGGTVPHIELIKQLKQRGYYVILVDYYQNPVAKPYADLHLQESTLDQERVYELARQYNVDLVISTSIDQANITACYVMEQLHQTPPYSYEIAKRITNKGDMKKTMWENQIPTSRYIYLESEDDLQKENHLRYPVIVKPADANSSKGVKIAQNVQEALGYVSDALVISRNNKAIVEEYITGREASVYCYIDEEKAHVLLISQRISRVDGQAKAIKCYAAASNLKLSAQINERIEWSVNAIANAYGLKSTPFFMQIIIQEHDISVIEFAPRTGGGMCFETVTKATRFNYISSAIDSFLGIKTACQPERTDDIYVTNTLYARDGIFGHIDGIEPLLADGTIENIYPIKTPGMTFESGTASTERVAFLIIRGKDKQEVCDKAHKAVQVLEVYDDQGNPIMRRDMYLRIEDIES